jgi:hypothetical protein
MEAQPRHSVEVVSELPERRHVDEGSSARIAAYREDSQFSCAVQLCKIGDGSRTGRDVAAEQIRDKGRPGIGHHAAVIGMGQRC